MNHFVIIGQFEEPKFHRMFWSNDNGWVGDIESATRFEAWELPDMNFPMEASVIRWVD